MLLMVLFVANFQAKAQKKSTTKKGVTISFEDKKNRFTKENEKLIRGIIVKAEKKVRKLLPLLPKSIAVKVMILDRKLDQVGGATGRTERHKPNGEVIILLSSLYPGGIAGAAQKGLEAVVFHEFHHLYRGWAIKDNKFGPGIDIATVNEGLAVVFSEEYTGVVTEGNSYPKGGADSWVKEILQLPRNANYGKWMFMHPDGREAVGYRAGHYLIRMAMKKSGKNILELSKLIPQEIYQLAGY